MRTTLKSTGEVATFAAANFGLTVRKAEGYCNGSNHWLMFFDIAGNAVPATNDVPMRCVQVFGNDGFTFSWEEDDLACVNGLYVALSSTDATYTAAVATTASLQIDVEMVTQQGTTAVGSLTATDRAILQVWSEATGPKLLTDLYIKNATGAAAFALLFATDTNADGDKPIGALLLTSSSSIQRFSFGDGRQIASQTAAGVNKVGCTIRLSSTAPTLTGVVNTNCRMLAYYK